MVRPREEAKQEAYNDGLAQGIATGFAHTLVGSDYHVFSFRTDTISHGFHRAVVEAVKRGYNNGTFRGAKASREVKPLGKRRTPSIPCQSYRKTLSALLVGGR